MQKTPFYLDFESNKAGDIFLVGLKYHDKFCIWVVDEKLAGITQNDNYQIGQNLTKLEKYYQKYHYV